MDTQTWIAIGSLALTAIALFYGARAGNASKAQTALQAQLRRDAAQPYVWVDVRPDDEEGGLILLIVGNSGPTVATNIKVVLDPPLPTGDRSLEASEAQAQLAQGIQSLPPGRILNWAVGVGFDLAPASVGVVHKATVTAEGPFGPLVPLEYPISLADLLNTRMARPGTLNRSRGS
ncbi:hypothetical protein ACSMXN_14470 [Jatrophihabitans sp. DSM 45814]